MTTGVDSAPQLDGHELGVRFDEESEFLAGAATQLLEDREPNKSGVAFSVPIDERLKRLKELPLEIDASLNKGWTEDAFDRRQALIIGARKLHAGFKAANASFPEPVDRLSSPRYRNCYKQAIFTAHLLAKLGLEVGISHTAPGSHIGHADVWFRQDRQLVIGDVHGPQILQLLRDRNKGAGALNEGQINANPITYVRLANANKKPRHTIQHGDTQLHEQFVQSAFSLYNRQNGERGLMALGTMAFYLSKGEYYGDRITPWLVDEVVKFAPELWDNSPLGRGRTNLQREDAPGRIARWVATMVRAAESGDEQSRKIARDELASFDFPQTD